MRMIHATRPIAYYWSPRCQMWYQRVIETDTTQFASTIVQNGWQLSPSTAGTTVQGTQVSTTFSQDRQCVDDSPAQFRRVRLRCWDQNANVQKMTVGHGNDRSIDDDQVDFGDDSPVIERVGDGYVIENGVAFSRYELELAVALKLWIKETNNWPLSDEKIGLIFNSLRGRVNRAALPCQGLVVKIQRHPQEKVRAIYMSVYVSKSYWDKEARRVYDAWTSRHYDRIAASFEKTSF